ncbi:MAG: 5'-nucleotidase C-terminal domain-containing protein [Actinomycetes bacterium]
MRARTPLVVALIVGVLTVLGALPVGASHDFEDVPDSNIFHGDIEWLKEKDITRGCNPPDNTLFCPDDFVTRGQMAAFFVRALKLSDTEGAIQFTDIDDSVFKDDILALSAAGITRGCNPPANDEFCPNRFVTRGQMAAFFVRALGLSSLDGATDFTDTDGHLFEGDIALLSAAGITRGCNPPDNDRYCPDDFVTREQMAAFFKRALGGPLDLTILHINDHHSHLAPNEGSLTLGGLEVDVEMGGFARVAAKIKAVEAEADNVLKVHAGDAITGTLHYTLFQGEADAAAMNEVCFDVFELGNHEFDDGDDGLAQFLDWLNEGDCGTVTLGANVVPGDDSPLKDGYIEPYTIVRFGGKPVGVIGIDIATKTKVSSRPFESTQFLDEVQTLQRYVDRLEAMGVDRIIGVTHYQYQNDLALAAAVDGIDVIVGGDSHSLLGAYEPFGLGPEGPYPTVTQDAGGSTVCIVQAWQYSNIVGQLDVRWDDDGEVTRCGGHPTLLIGDTFTVEGEELSGADLDQVLAAVEATPLVEIVDPDPATQAVIDTYSERASELEQQVIATVTETLCLERIPGQNYRVSPPDCPEGYGAEHGGDAQQLVTEAFRVRSLNADIAIQNSGGVREIIFPGDFTVADAYRLLPFSNTMVDLEVTGAEIREVLNQAVDFAVQPDGSTGAYPYGAGIRWDVDFDAPAGQKITNIEVRRKGETDWSPLDDNATYIVVTNDFVATGGDGYQAFAEAYAEGRYSNIGLFYTQSFIDYVVEDLGGVISKLPVEEYSTQNVINPYTPAP